jgi:hypothetical protein
MTEATTKPKRSILEYKRETELAKARAKCKVCQLAPELQKQIAEAREKEVPNRIIIDWLKDEYRKELAVQDLQSHSNGRHG